jgi:N-acetylmuramoyl-L-alanine amidase
VFSSTGLDRNVIVLDPSHGGVDSGARIGNSTLEKNVTLAFAFRLRSLLMARGFTVVLTRDSDAATEPSNPSNPLTLDDRAGIANHGRAAACLLLHATGRGTGVHLYSSELDAAPGLVPLLPWLTAQAAWVPASQALEQQLGAALGRSHIGLVSSAASIRPLDSLTCPALVVELAPETDNPLSITDAGYQERVAAAMAGALVFWQNAAQQPPRIAEEAPSVHTVHRRAAPLSAPAPEAQP